MLKFFYTLFFGILLVSGLQAQSDTLLVAKAQKGDGIISLLRRQGMDPYAHMDDFLALNESKLRDSIHLYEGRDYVLPKAVKVVEPVKTEAAVAEDAGSNFVLFGEKYARVPVKSQRLQGTVYYLVSGHGGPESGAMTSYGGHPISEDEYAYDVTLRLARELISHGALVYVIIRDADDGIRDDRILEMDHDEVAYPNETIPLDQLERLRQRADIVNKLYAEHKGLYQRLIVTHVDSRSKGQNIDVFFYHHEKSQNGKKLAESIHKTFYEKYHQYQPNRTYEGTFADRTNLYMVKKTHPAMTFIEIGNISNPQDQKRILDPDNRQALAKWIAEGVLLDFEN